MNIALGVEYCGAFYSGWQRQKHSSSVQQTLEEVLSQIANHEVSVYCAGRTDSGVHATGQIVNFALSNERPLKAWEQGANALLPDDIKIRWAKALPSEFHARHSAYSRRYRYVIQNTHYRSAILNGKVTCFRPQLNEKAMHQGAQSLLGEQDFKSFQASSCQSLTSFRCVNNISVVRLGEFVIIDITANAFLHHMVRNIAGCLLEVGEGKQTVEYVSQVLAMKDRTQAPATAKPDGLYLVKVGYPAKYEVPDCTIGPLTFPDDINL